MPTITRGITRHPLKQSVARERLQELGRTHIRLTQIEQVQNFRRVSQQEWTTDRSRHDSRPADALRRTASASITRQLMDESVIKVEMFQWCLALDDGRKGLSKF
jgi:hypothetical protein